MEDTKEMEDMKNYLYIANNSMKDEIIAFINSNSLKNLIKKLSNVLKQLAILH